jgi:hypothetical protein
MNELILSLFFFLLLPLRHSRYLSLTIS